MKSSQDPCPRPLGKNILSNELPRETSVSSTLNSLTIPNTHSSTSLSSITNSKVKVGKGNPKKDIEIQKNKKTPFGQEVSVI
jgi:CCR4-NOT transcriptional regulation complex NOT5 subunit